MEERMSGVRGGLNYAGCFAEAAGSVDRVNGWEAGFYLCTPIGPFCPVQVFHKQLLTSMM